MIYLLLLVGIGLANSSEEDNPNHKPSDILSRSARQAVSNPDCDFPIIDDKTTSCGWSMSVKEFTNEEHISHKVKWILGKPEETYFLGGPETDGDGTSINSNSGYASALLAQVLKIGAEKNPEAFMVTPRQPRTAAKGKCLSFKYATSGLCFSSFTVLLLSYEEDEDNIVDDSDNAIEGEEAEGVNNEEETPNTSEEKNTLKYDLTKMAVVTEETDGEWRDMSITFASTGAYSIAFSAKGDFRNYNYMGYASIDMVEFTDGPCGNDCMFDYDFCLWVNEDNGVDDFDWKLSRSSLKRGTGPSRDQSTYRNADVLTGGYIFLDSDHPNKPGDTARLISPEIGGHNSYPQCLSFWTNRHGSGIGILRVILKGTEEKVIWELKDKSGTDRWFYAQVTVYASETQRVIIEGTTGVPGSSDIAIDSVTFKRGPCPIVPANSAGNIGDCVFRENMCDWKKTEDSGTMLSRTTGIGSKHNAYGHTWNLYEVPDMYYMKWDMSNDFVLQPRTSEGLQSPVLRDLDTKPLCMSFWFFSYSTISIQNKIGSLVVRMKTSDNEIELWRAENRQQSDWTYAQVSLSGVEAAWVEFRGIRGPSLMGGFIGVDDISVFEGECETIPGYAKATLGNCAFDNEMCNWEIKNPDPTVTNPALNFRLAATETSGLDILDHTYQADQGGYAFITTFNSNKKSRLLSPIFEEDQVACITFWFSRDNAKDDAATLTLYGRDVEEGAGDVLWQVTKSDMPDTLGDDWQFGVVPMDAGTGYTQVYFEAEVYRSAWAIDDIVFSDTSCKRILPDYADLSRQENASEEQGGDNRL